MHADISPAAKAIKVSQTMEEAGIRPRPSARQSISLEHGSPASDGLCYSSSKISAVMSQCPQECKNMKGKKKATIPETQEMFMCPTICLNGLCRIHSLRKRIQLCF